MPLWSSLVATLVLAQLPDGGAAQQSVADAGETAFVDGGALDLGDAGVDVSILEDGGTAEDAGIEQGFTLVPARQVPVLQIFGADGGVVYSAPVTGEAAVIPLAPGSYSLQLGDGARRAFTLREDDAPEIQATNLKVNGVWPEGADIPLTEARPTLRTVKSPKQIEVRLGMGESFVSRSRPEQTGVLSVLVGITERLQWNAPMPYFSYLLGEPGVREWVVEGGVNGIGANPIGFFTGLSASVGRRSYWRTERSWTAGAEVTGGLAFGSPLLRSFSYVSGRIHSAYSVTVNRRWTFNPGVALNAAMRPFGTGFTISSAREPIPGRPSLAIGSVMRLAGRDHPLVQWNYSRRLSFDLYSTFAVGYFSSQAPLQDRVDNFPLYGDVIVGFTYVGG